ncbi:aladin-like isoform X2 [Dendronephthya gigantea]|nr:aladin-like isoform X2 [Dendronephthya gigantea]
MSSLAVFPAPYLHDLDTVTISEYNSNFLVGENPRELQPCLYTFGQDGRFDQILASEDPLKMPTNLARDYSESPFLAVEESLSQKLYNIWLSEGFNGVLEELSQTESNEVPLAISSVSKCLFAFIKWVENFSEKFVFGKQNQEHLESEFSSECRGPIKAFAWHPHLAKFAVGLEDDSIRIFAVKRGLTKLLNNRYQKAVSCCAWRPLSSSVLAVGCQNGIMIWTINQHSSAIRQGASSVQHLVHPGHSFVTSMSWSPGGRLLVSGSASSGAMMVWDVTMESGTALHRIGGSISQVTWSPCDTKVFVAATSSLIRVWETQRWTCEKWTNLASNCQAACWSPDGKFLLFSVAEEKSLYYLRFCEPVGTTGMENFSIGGAKMAVKCADLSEHSWEVNGKTVSIGGYVSNMAWDPNGERLALILKDDTGKTQDYIPVFKTNLENIFDLVPSGFIHGAPSDGQPQNLSFQQNYRQGALLSIIWSSGKISFVPMIFSPRAMIRRNGRHEQIPVNGHGNTGLYSNVDNNSR